MVIVEWGLNVNNIRFIVLKEVQIKLSQVPILNIINCFKLKKKSLKEHIYAGGESRNGSRRGYSGRPLIHVEKMTWLVISGIVLFGSQFCCQIGMTAEYVKVSNYVDWIQNLINKN